jgi:hypothetical protein
MSPPSRTRNAGPDPRPIKLDFLFASADSDHSERPIDTLMPLSQALGLENNSKHSNEEHKRSPGTS